MLPHYINVNSTVKTDKQSHYNLVKTNNISQL